MALLLVLHHRHNNRNPYPPSNVRAYYDTHAYFDPDRSQRDANSDPHPNPTHEPHGGHQESRCV